MLAFAAGIWPSMLPLAARAATQAQPFSIDLPPDFVVLKAPTAPSYASRSSLGGVIFVAGDYRNTIATTGGATTISIQLLDRAPAPAATTELADALASVRDASSGLPVKGATQVLTDTLRRVDEGGSSFEMLTPLIAGDPRSTTPDLVRHTLVRTLPFAPAGSSGLLVLWAGARESDWRSGAGDALRAAAETLVVRPSFHAR